MPLKRKTKTRLAGFLLLLGQGFQAVGQDLSPVDRTIRSMNGVDTFMVYGDLCSGCIRGTRKRVHVLWKRKETVWIRSYEYEGRFEYVLRTREVKYDKDPFAFYTQHKPAIDAAIERSETLGADTTVVGDGRILMSEGPLHGYTQRIYIHYPTHTGSALFCCGSYQRYQERNPQLVTFFSLFPEAIDPEDVVSKPEPVIRSITR